MSGLPLLRSNACAGAAGMARQRIDEAEPTSPIFSSGPRVPFRATTKADYWGKALRRLDQAKRNCIQQALDKQHDESDKKVYDDKAGETTRLVRKESSISWPETLSELCRHCQKLEDDRAKKTNFRFAGRDVNLRKTLETWIKFFNKIKHIGDVAVNVDPIHAGLPWAAIRLILTAATASSDQNGAIYVGIEKVLFLLNRGAAYEFLLAHLRGHLSAETLANFEEALVQLYKCLLDFLAVALVVRVKNAFKRAFYAFWSPQDISSFCENCLELEKTLEIESKLVESQSNREIAESIERILKASDCLEDMITDTKSLVQALRSEIKEQHRREQEERENEEALSWVSSIPILDHHEDAREGRTPDTGQWVFTKPEFLNWETASSSSLLWIHGIPGAGKTKLVTTIVDHFLQLRRSSQDPVHVMGNSSLSNHEPPVGISDPSPLAFFYCRRADAERRVPENVLRSFLKQLALSHNKSLASLRTTYMEKKREGFLSRTLSTKECQDLLIKMISLCPEVILILDALDECDEQSRHKLITVLHQLVDHHLPVKILISSRRDDDITAEFEEKVNFSLSATENHDDIMRFVQENIQEYRNSKRTKRKLNSAISADLEQQIIKVFLEKSNGMFQWAALHLAHLLSLDRPSDISKALQSLPRGLEKTYGEIFERITNPDNSLREIAIRTFLWLLAQGGAAVGDQLLAVVCQDLDADEIHPVDIDPETVLKACQNLVVQDKHLLIPPPPPPPPHHARPLTPPPPPSPPRLKWGSSRKSLFRFAHLSVQEYCEKIQWTQQVAHTFAAKTCFLFLLQPPETLPAISQSASTTQRSYWNHPYYEEETGFVKNFADSVWIYHTQRCCASEPAGQVRQDERLVTLATRFLGFPNRTSKEFDEWLSRFSWDPKSRAHFRPAFWSNKRKKKVEGIDLLPSYAKGRLKHLTFPPFNFENQSSLVVCFFGIDHIFFPRINDNIATPPLLSTTPWPFSESASFFSHFSTSRTLRSILNPLVLADAEKANKVLWEVLISLQNHPLGLIYTWSFPDYFSLCLGFGELVHQLQLRDAIEMCGMITTCLLYPQFLSPHSTHYPDDQVLQIISKIISLGANLDPALLEALQRRSWHHIAWLIERGAKSDIDALGATLENSTFDKLPPFHICQILIDHPSHRVDVDASIKLFGKDLVGTPLMAACIGGNVALAQLFVDAGATVNVILQNTELYSNQFCKPVWTSRPEIQTLKEIPATFGSALIEASARGHAEICRVLVKHGADLNEVLVPRLGYFGTPLIAACAFNHYDTCKMLLECGIDATTKAWRRFKSSSADPIITNALITAASNGGLEICRLLLSRGVDVNVIIPRDSINSFGSQGTALIAAASNGHIGICELLLDHGAFLDAIVPDASFPTALIAAASKGKWKACELLCDRGADMNLVVPNLPYGNALIAACRWRHLKTIEILVQRGANVNMDPITGDYGRKLLAACMGYDAKRRKVIKLMLPRSSLASLKVDQIDEKALRLTRERLRAASPFVSKINLKNKQTFSQVQEELQRKIASFTDDYFHELFDRDDLQILFDLIYDPLIITKKLRGLTKKAVSRIAGRLRDRVKLRELFERFPLLAADVALAFVEDIRTARLVSRNPTPVESRDGSQRIWE